MKDRRFRGGTRRSDRRKMHLIAGKCNAGVKAVVGEGPVRSRRSDLDLAGQISRNHDLDLAGQIADSAAEIGDLSEAETS